MSFVGVQPFTEKSMFDFWIASPAKEERPGSLRRLQDIIKITCLRRTKQSINDSLKLPERLERTEHVKLHGTDCELYDFFKERTTMIAAGGPGHKAGIPRAEDPKEANILSLINFLRLICDHGKSLLPPSALEVWKTRDSASVDWQMMRSWKRRCDMCDAELEESEAVAPDSCEHFICSRCRVQNKDITLEENIECPKCSSTPSIPFDPDLRSTTPILARPSAKVEALLRNLNAEQGPESHTTPEKAIKRYRGLIKLDTIIFKLLIVLSVIFSYWTKMLDLIEPALKSGGFCFQRIDGKTSLEGRSAAINEFSQNPKCTVMLASIGSAGEG
jgi:SNF2 family DNA or RNA helicase